ncbi:hypothetical protein BJ912DRAFT_927602 [Pholiota molesta]|nr:hypothetical protein BJ912DRAFT_927602 [Pholiota molesta]
MARAVRLPLRILRQNEFSDLEGGELRLPLLLKNSGREESTDESEVAQVVFGGWIVVQVFRWWGPNGLSGIWMGTGFMMTTYWTNPIATWYQLKRPVLESNFRMSKCNRYPATYYTLIHDTNIYCRAMGPQYLNLDWSTILIQMSVWYYVHSSSCATSSNNRMCPQLVVQASLPLSATSHKYQTSYIQLPRLKVIPTSPIQLQATMRQEEQNRQTEPECRNEYSDDNWANFTEARSRNNRPTAAVGGLAGGAGQSTKK